jgi:RNA polymerase sigma factor (sigma-70 family)
MRTEDGYIIQRCLDGDAEAFGFLVDKYKKSVYALAYSRIRNFHDAQDITQEVFIKAYRSLRTLRSWDNFMGWLYRITANLSKNWLRSQSRRPDGEFVEDQEPEVLDRRFVNLYHENVMCDSIREALDSLPEIYRQVLTLRYFGGMTIREMSRFIGVSPATIKRRLKRAQEQMKEEMLATMSASYEQNELPESFTFSIVEMVKRIRFHPLPRVAGLPWGLSLAAGIIATVLSLNPSMSIQNPASVSPGSPLSSEVKVHRTGEIPVEILGISRVPFISNRQGDGDGGNPAGPNAFFLALRGEPGTWTRKADMPTARWSHSASVVNRKIYVIGGWDGSLLSALEEYDPETDKWVKKADMPTPRQFLSTSAVNGKIYAIGGYGGGPIERAAVEEYDPVKDKWTKKADIPTPRMFFSTSVVKGKIYAIGGWKQGAVISPSPVEEYDPVADEWTKKPDMPGIAVRGLSASVVNDRIYVFGGWDGNKDVSTVREYNPIAGTWTKKTDMPTARANFSTSVVDEKIYAIGRTADVEEYDPLTDKWTKKADMAIAREGISTSTVNGKIYVIGGWDGKAFLSTVEEYDTGFSGKSVEATGKLPTKWGKMKQY